MAMFTCLDPMHENLIYLKFEIKCDAARKMNQAASIAHILQSCTGTSLVTCIYLGFVVIKFGKFLISTVPLWQINRIHGAVLFENEGQWYLLQSFWKRMWCFEEGSTK